MTAESTSRALKPIDEVRGAITAMAPEFTRALPSHISVDKFQRVAITCINSNPDLLKADKHSLYAACMKSAQDGLLPDGREAAFVIFGQQVQYMPMVGGILKKIRNSGELSSIAAHIVHKADTFEYFVNDEGEHFKHVPNLFVDDRGAILGAYCVAKMKDGGTYFEFMTRVEIEKVRAVSRSKDSGPWKTWWDEQAKKTVIKRLAKRLPMSTDLESVIKADNDLYEPDAGNAPAPAAAQPQAQEPAAPRKARRPRGLQAAMDGDGASGPVIDNDTGEVQNDDVPI